MVYSNSTQTYIPTEDKVKQKKWSTFLIKPDRPQPQPKKTPEEQKLEVGILIFYYSKICE